MPRKNRQAKIRKYFNQQAGKCAYCDAKMTLDLGFDNTAEVDHIIPKSHMRISGPFNEVACCSICNSIKGNKPLNEAIDDIKRKRRRSSQKQLELF